VFYVLSFWQFIFAQPSFKNLITPRFIFAQMTRNSEIINTFFIDFQEFADPNDPTTVVYNLPSSVIAQKNKLVKIKFWAVESLTTPSFLFSPELTLKYPYLSNLTAGYIPFKQSATPFQDSYSISSNVTKLTFRVLSDNVFQAVVDPINAYLVFDIVASSN
jgi:hypothetical protein